MYNQISKYFLRNFLNISVARIYTIARNDTLVAIILCRRTRYSRDEKLLCFTSSTDIPSILPLDNFLIPPAERLVNLLRRAITFEMTVGQLPLVLVFCIRDAIIYYKDSIVTYDNQNSKIFFPIF